ncbi:Glycerophosphocholine phosphodiesterase GPCPD1 [Hypsibius exemplaris]|uniref:Glycerophosphocholine phosphodiesterase GPCPD1 n=1 Tax=Hypsibius exemplaris TaxID=2072580 RepID=A0A9X6RLW4_HYPEX|nr:Glycerophosphocholine phosphodiesterase GPCPD1 [Hypsibius exemplaris]
MEQQAQESAASAVAPSQHELSVRFAVTATTASGEFVFLSGSCHELGKWRLSGAVVLNKEDSTTTSDTAATSSNLWTLTIPLPVGQEISYRYFVGTYGELHGSERVVLVRTFESHIESRKVRTPQTNGRVHEATYEPAQYGLLGGKERVQRGWLSAESEVHLRFLSNAIHWWKARHRAKAHSILIVPMDLRYRENSQEDEDDLSSPYANEMELAVLNQDECRFRQQGKFGRILKPDEVVIFRMRVLEPQFMAYRCDFFAYEPGTEDVAVTEEGPQPKNVGCCYIFPSNAKDSYGDRTVMINGMKHQPIGQLFVHYMMVQPCKAIESTLEVSYAKYWRKRKPLDIGHRGSGNSFSVKTQCASLRENTIASLAGASSNGADFVEFDVQLSKDKVPVIYHDFTCYITMRRRHGSGDSISSTSSNGSSRGDGGDAFGELYEMPVKDLTLHQLHMLKLNHVSEKDGSTKYNVADDHQPFPSLEKALRVLDPDVGFNVEIKFPLSYKDGKHEAENYFERNEFVDVILAATYKHAGKRRIIFSCFDPDTCAMVRVKQNKYPVSYLSHGEVTLWPAYADSRTHTTRTVLYTAIAYDLLGINVHTQNVLTNEWLIQEAKDAGMVLIVWGDENNDPAVIRQMNDSTSAGV